ncbi:MAG: nucleotidyltransferase substrate binding protein [Candidatus Poribacteria bacterium]|nr:nucleotidyltransferase substrate binding protein [Candidatus Poribacteria bacterium]
MNSDLITLISAARQKVLNTIMLVEASLSRITPYDVNQNYTPEEMEPYDAMSGRFIRAVEVSLKFFRTYERYLFAESSDTIRDLLNRMATVDLITSTQLWVAMRDVRNRIVHDYLPKDIKQIYDSIQNQFGNELKQLQSKLIDLSID